jgi:hypothetical protein
MAVFKETIMELPTKDRIVSLVALSLLTIALSVATDSATNWLQLSLTIVEFTLEGQDALMAKLDAEVTHTQTLQSEVLKEVIDLSAWAFKLIK